MIKILLVFALLSLAVHTFGSSFVFKAANILAYGLVKVVS